MSWRRLKIPRGKAWQATRRAVFRRDGRRCCHCGRPGRLECDHVTPLWRDPLQDPFDPAGCQSLCRSCHIAKTADERRRIPTESEAAWAAFRDELRGS